MYRVLIGVRNITRRTAPAVVQWQRHSSTCPASAMPVRPERKLSSVVIDHRPTLQAVSLPPYYLISVDSANFAYWLPSATASHPLQDREGVEQNFKKGETESYRRMEGPRDHQREQLIGPQLAKDGQSLLSYECQHENVPLGFGKYGTSRELFCSVRLERWRAVHDSCNLRLPDSVRNVTLRANTSSLASFLLTWR
jgi:hypothetical protein